MFNITHIRNEPAIQQSNLIIKKKPKLAKCVSIVHLFGNAYSTQQYMSRHKTNDMTSNKSRLLFPTRNSTNVTNKLKIERFKHRSENQIDLKTNDDQDEVDEASTKTLPIEDFCDDKDLGTRAFRTISRVIAKQSKKKKNETENTQSDNFHENLMKTILM